MSTGTSKIKKLTLFFLYFFLSVVSAGIIFFFWKPIALWYWRSRPVLGVDFYNLASYVAYFSRHFVLPFNGWKYTWWTGGPLLVDYPILHAYLVLPLLRFFNLPEAVLFYSLSFCFLYLLFAYFLFAEVGKDRVLAVVLTIAYSFSIGLYGALVWGGSLPYFATQIFLPVVLLFLIKYFNTHNERWYYLSALFLGLSFLGHVQVGFSYIIPITFLLFLADSLGLEKFFSPGRVVRIFKYFFIAVLVGYPQLSSYVGRTPSQIIFYFIPSIIIPLFKGFFKSAGKASVSLSPAGSGEAVSGQPVFTEAMFNRSQLQRLFVDTHNLFFVFLAIAGFLFLFSFLLRRKRINSLKTIVYILPTIWVVFYISLFGFGVSLFHGSWYRVFWPLPLVLGMLISFIWRDFWFSVKERFDFMQKKFFRFLIPVVSSALVVIIGLPLLFQNTALKMINKIETPLYVQQSSAFPDSMNVYINQEEFPKLKERLTPSWLEVDNTQYRLFDADQRVNIWWNALYDLPLVKGYIEIPPADSTGAYYWTSIVLAQTSGKDALVESWGVPVPTAFNNALFLIDWFSIRYIGGEHEPSDSYNPLTSYLKDSEIIEKREEVIVPGWVQLYGTKDNKIKFHPGEKESLTYYKIRDEDTSPIVHTTDATVIGVIGGDDAYQTIFRNLAAVNLNSRRLIPVKLGKFIDDVSLENLKDMEAVILYSYDYRNHNQAWAKLEKYVKEGGKLIIETGSDVKQTSSQTLPVKYSKELPVVFPIKMTKQEKMGKEWKFSSGAKEVEALDFSQFGPPILNNEPWSFSLPVSKEDLKKGAREILANQDIPLIVSWKYGEGEVVWSGMNLPYHINASKSMEEAKLLKNLIEKLVNTNEANYSDYTVERKSPGKVVINGKGAKGVLFRENADPGWGAKLVSAKKAGSLRIYKTGPTHHGFSYVKIPREARDSFTVTFTYKGNFWNYFWLILSLFTILTLLDIIIFNGRFLTPQLKKVFKPVGKKVGSWWDKEEGD